MFNEGQPWYVMSGTEWHAFGYGLKDGFKFWKRTHILYSQIDALDESPEVKDSLKKDWHYYEIGSDLPEDVVLLAGLVYLVATGQAMGLVKMALATAGITI